MAENGKEELSSQGTQLLLLSGNYLWYKLAGSSWVCRNGRQKEVTWWTCRYHIQLLVVSFAQSLKVIYSVTHGLALVTERC
jgi:hypothetical protein